MIVVIMENTTPTTSESTRATTRELSFTIRRWTRDLGHLRTRVVRLKRQPGVPDGPVDATLEEAIGLCTQLLQDLAGAEMEIQRCLADVRTERQQADYLFDRMLVPSLHADDQGRIIRANRAAALLLNVSARHLVGQPLLHFTQDREGFMDLLHRMRREPTPFQCELTIRPRERSTLHAGVTLMPRSPGNTAEWLWFVAPNGSGPLLGQIEQGDGLGRQVNHVSVERDIRLGGDQQVARSGGRHRGARTPKIAGDEDAAAPDGEL
jgi:PAS domain-containing protein